MPFDLHGRAAIVTGGSRGIGRAVAISLAECGARVAINYLANAAAAAETATLISSSGSECITVQGDVRRAEDVRRLVDETSRAFGKVDILVNNAGITRDNLLLRMSEEEWDEVVETNLRSAFLCTRTALRSMIRQRWGRIINVGSAGGIVGNAGQTNYSAAKAGLIGFTKALAKEVASRGVTANVIAPGFVETGATENLTDTQRQAIIGQIPMGRAAQAEEIGPAVAFLASEEAAYITGHVLTIDGGLAMA
jgi:3-oxoacyl-[acyl-carrier protein] reductase